MIKPSKPKRAILLVFEDDFEESYYEKSLPYLMSEPALAVIWNNPVEDAGGLICNQRNSNYSPPRIPI